MATQFPRLVGSFLFLFGGMLLPARAQFSPLSPAPVKLVSESSSAVDFGALTLGQTSGTSLYTLQFQAAAKISGVRVLSEGRAGGAFVAANTADPAACQPGAYAAGASCTVGVTFTPDAPGINRGAVVLLDGNQQPLAAVYLRGSGLAPRLLFIPGTPATGPGATFTPAAVVSAIALDGNGNLYTNEGGGLVRHASDGSATTLLSNVGISSLATDGAGYVYACESGTIATIGPDGVQVQRLGANITALGATVPPRAVGVAVDAAGDLFAAETAPQSGLSDVRRVTPDGTSSILLALPAGEVVGPAMTADGAGAVYVFSNRAVRRILPDGTAAILASGDFSAVHSAAVDAGGTLYLPNGAARLRQAPRRNWLAAPYSPREIAC